MQSKINLKLLNIFVFGAWTITTIYVIAVEIQRHVLDISQGTLSLFFLDTLDEGAILTILLAICAAGTFFFMAHSYNQIRKIKTDKYLSSLIMYTMVYQGISRVVEVYYLLLGSDMWGLVNVIGRYYFPLEILGFAIFCIVVFDVFLFPAKQEAGNNVRGFMMIVLGISGASIGLITSLFHYFPKEFMTFKIITVLVGLGIFGTILVVVAITCFKIFRLSRTVSEHGNKRAVQVLGIQLLALTAALILFVIAETADFLVMDPIIGSFIDATKNALYLFIAILYLYSFIKPSKSKKTEMAVQA
jgi:hypothetical protein